MINVNAAALKAWQETAQTSKPHVVSNAGSKAPLKPPETVDRVTLSPDAVARAEEREKKRNEYLQSAESMKQMLKEMNESSRDKSNGMDDLQKCFIIASRIISGDYVSRQDEKFLAEHSSELYSQAIMLRRQKEKPEKHKSITEQEEKSRDNMLAVFEQESSGGAVERPEGGEGAPDAGENPSGGEN